MDRVKPYFKRLASALKFQPYTISSLEHESDPVYELFFAWLRGANKEHDPRPQTWSTLISALRVANIQEEADILESFTAAETTLGGNIKSNVVLVIL